jgi:glycosyltransferase involved in cell wall biosynthesis
VKVAYFSPLPPDRSGIADYSALLLPALRQRIDVEVVRTGRTRPVADADVALYHVGNNPEVHDWIVDALRRRPGVVVLHDFVLHHLVAGLTLGRKDADGYLAAMEREGGVPARLLAFGVVDAELPPLWETWPDEFPLTGEILDLATGLIVHSRHVEQLVRDAGYRGPIWVIPMPAWPVDGVEPARVDGGPVFGCFGHLNESKRIPELLDAFELVRRAHPRARLLLVGPASPGYDLDALLPRDGVVREDYVEEHRLWQLMAACDGIVALRFPTMGETSSPALRALSLGKALVVSDVGWFAELPDDVALKVPPGGDGEVEALAVALERLADPAARSELETGARALVAREHGLDAVADRYVEALEQAAGGSIVEDRILREIAGAAADVGLDPEPLAPLLRDAGLAGQNGHVAVPGTRARPKLARLMRAVPVWAWLGLIVLTSIAIRVWIGRKMAGPWILVDELIYEHLARSFASSGEFLVRGEHASYGVVYPVLLAPAFALFDSLTRAYSAVKDINAVLMSIAAIPAYFLARRVLMPAWSLLAAVFAVALPSLAYTGTLMTENAFYPVFLCVALALVLVLERPTALRQLVLLALVVVAYLTRTQAVVLVPAILSAPIVAALIDRRELRSLRSYLPMFAVSVVGCVAVLVYELARGHSPFAALGAYEATRNYHYSVGAALRWFVYHVADLDLYVGVIPFAAFVVVVANARYLDRPVRLFTAAALSLSLWLVAQVAVFASTVPAPARIEERNIFYVAPFLLTALLVWIARGMPRPPRAVVVAAIVAGLLPAVLPYQTLIDTPAESDTLVLLPLWWIHELGVNVNTIVELVVPVAAGLALVFLLVSRRYAAVLPAIVLVWLVFVAERVVFFDHGFVHASEGALFQGITTGKPNWIDRKVGGGANVAYLWSGNNAHAFQLWENEFFNRSIRTVYDLEGQSPGNLAETPLKQTADGVLLGPGRKPLRVPYVVSDTAVPLAGRVLATDPLKGTVLVRPEQPLRITYRTAGIDANTWSGPKATYTRPRCDGGTIAVKLLGDPSLVSRVQTVTAAVDGRVVATARVNPRTTSPATLTVPLTPRLGECRVVFHVSPTAVPAQVIRGSTDTRRLGVHFLAFGFRRR